MNLPAAIDYSHQEVGAEFLAARRFALLADEPGLGKSRTTVLACDKLGAKRILVMCPGAVRQHWAREFDHWSRYQRDITVEEGYLRQPPGNGVTIVSHAVASDAVPSPKRPGRGQSIGNLLAGEKFDAIIADESHEFRDYNAARTRTLFAPSGLVSHAHYLWALSGTPVVNSAADLFPYVCGALGSQVSWQEFCEHYTELRPDAYVGQKPTGIKNAEELASGLKPYVLRRTIGSLGIKMPPLSIPPVDLPVSPEALSRIMADLEGWTPERLTQALEEQDDLRDSAMARVRRVLGAAKVAPTTAYADALLRSGEGPLVVFFHHTDTRVALFNALRQPGWRCSWIDGKISRQQLNAAEQWFQAGRLDVLLVQTQAGGQGLTLTRSHRALVAELPWTATALFQAVKRIHRIGQTLACQADTLSAAGCWLEKVMGRVVSTKRRASDDLLDRLTTSV